MTDVSRGLPAVTAASFSVWPFLRAFGDSGGYATSKGSTLPVQL